MAAASADYVVPGGPSTEPGVVLLSAPTAGGLLGQTGKVGKKRALDSRPMIRGLYEFSEPVGSAAELGRAASDASVVAVSFSARLAIPGIRGYPHEHWIARFGGRKAVFHNQPLKSWPRVTIEFEMEQPLANPSLEGFLEVLPHLRFAKLDARPSGDSSKAEILYTAVILSAEAAQVTSLQSAGGFALFTLKHERMPDEAREQLRFRAALYRKIRYIEYEFETEFSLPNYVSPEDVRLVETLYDGILHGVATTRGSDITLPGIRGRDFALSGSPFSSPGAFRGNVSWEGKWFGLFGQRLEVGRVDLVLDAAEAAEPRVVDQMRREPDQTFDLRLVVYDHQIRHRFEKYLRRPIKKRLESLSDFIRRLTAHEPREIAQLVSTPLIKDVDSERAVQIAKGWLYMSQFTERYCPQDPTLDSGKQTRAVPIHLVYTNGKGGLVGKLNIDVKTGRVISHTDPEEMQNKAKALAESIFHA